MQSRASRSSKMVALLGCSALIGTSAAAQQTVDRVPSAAAPKRIKLVATPTQLRLSPPVSPVWDNVAVARWGQLDVNALLAEDAVRDGSPGVPMRIGVTRDVPGGVLTPNKAGTWIDGIDGGSVWLLRLEAADAKAIRIHFSQFDLEQGAEVRLRGILESVDAYTAKGPNNDGAFWAAPTPGNVAYVEYFSPTGNRQAKLAIDVISHFYRDPGFLPGDAQPNVPDPVGEDLLGCHESAMCHDLDPNARDAVGLMIFDGGFLCSGSLLNDVDANTYAGYFLTANHCINTQSSASNLTVYWFYQPAACGGAIPALSFRPKSIGAKLLANSSLSDFSFMRFNNDPEDGQGFAAWTTTPPSGTIQGIHHPGGSWKRYSMGATTSSAPICGALPTSRYVYNDWTLGVTEGGSSGSPLFNTNWEVVGQLYGICCSVNCSSINQCTQQSLFNNVYGRFSQSYTSFSTHLNFITPDDVYENNDSTAEAPGLAVGTHALRLVDYDDYFKITFDSDSDVTITTTFSTALMDLDLYLLDSASTVIASSVTANGVETIVSSVPAGVYYIRAAKDTGWGGDYSLDLSAFLADCPPPVAAAAEPSGFFKNRFISFVPENAGTQTAIRVKLMSLQRPNPSNVANQAPDFSAFEGQVRWVGPPAQYLESPVDSTNFMGAVLQCEPHFMDWGTVGLIHVFGSEVVPSSEYEIAAINPNCDPQNETNFAAALVLTTTRWGDVVVPFQQPSPAALSQPDIGDVSGLVDKFRYASGAPIVARAMLQPNEPDPTVAVNFSDISACVDSFKGVAYPFSGPLPCP